MDQTCIKMHRYSKRLVVNIEDGKRPHGYLPLKKDLLNYFTAQHVSLVLFILYNLTHKAFLMGIYEF